MSTPPSRKFPLRHPWLSPRFRRIRHYQDYALSDGLDDYQSNDLGDDPHRTNDDYGHNLRSNPDTAYQGGIPPQQQPETEGDYVPTAEDFLPSPPPPSSPLSRWPSFASLKPALVGFALFWAVSLHDWRLPTSQGSWVGGRAVFDHHEYWRLVSALFAHADVGHLVSNTPLYLIFGWFLYAFFGLWAFPFGALLVGALSNLRTIAVYPPDATLLGASGMLYGMVAMWLVLYIRFETTVKVGIRIFRAIAVSLLLLFPTTFLPTTSYLAHATGFTIGLAYGLALCPFIRVKQNP